MNRLSSLLQQPEYVHVALNHFPLVGLVVAVLAVAAALVMRNRPATFLSLGLLGLMALSAWPVYSYGEAGYDRVLSMSDDAGQAFLKYHAHLAERWVFLYYLTAASAMVGIGLGWKWPRLLLPLSIASIVLAVASLTAGIFIAHAGGEIRHREFRSSPPPAVSE
jgi:hypothetical protein